MNVRASVIDAAKDAPRSKDVFLVDTNVWYWFGYTRASLGCRPYQLQYAVYLKKALAIGATILHADFTLCELAHLIERAECDIALGPGTPIKQFRAVASNRTRTVGEIEIAWNTVTGISKPVQHGIPAGSSAQLLALLKTAEIDGYDAALALAAKAAGALLVTDDHDYGSVSGLKVLTLNNTLLGSAHKAGKKVTR